MSEQLLSWKPESSVERRPLSELHGSIGNEVFVTEWRSVDKEHLDQFRWSVDSVPELSDTWVNSDFPRASENIDGFMLLSLLQSAFFDNFPFYEEGVVTYNYGVDSLRFPATAYLEHKMRARAVLLSVTDKPSGFLCRVKTTMELHGEEKPALSLEFLILLTQTKVDR